MNIVYGPVPSRRLGMSLGVTRFLNLLVPSTVSTVSWARSGT
jgi:wyosine [tRNA(Phe)-imidazoG37] synthetase (radical SAM superfamily)